MDVEREICRKPLRIRRADELLVLVDEAVGISSPIVEGIRKIESLQKRARPPREETVRCVPGERAARLLAENGIVEAEVDHRVRTCRRSRVGAEYRVRALEGPPRRYLKRLVSVLAQDRKSV